jgi:molybdenum cofactor cytidylyltransferase
MKKLPAIAGVILAAGMSTRMGSPKQLLKLGDRYLLQLVVEAAVKSKLEKIYLVLGYQHERILGKLHGLRKNPKIEILHNPGFEEGMSSSVKCGVGAAQSDFDAVMFLLGDQPFVSPKMINRLLTEYNKSDRQICVPAFQGRRGNPAIFGSFFFKQLINISGDKGGRQIIQDNPEDVLVLPIKDPKALFDIDNPEDLKKLSKLYFCTFRGR